MFGGRGHNESWTQPKRKNKQEVNGFKFNGDEASGGTQKCCSNLPFPNGTLERKRSSSTCICDDAPEVPVKIMALSINECAHNGKFQNYNPKFVDMKVRKVCKMYPNLKTEVQTGQKQNSMPVHEKFQNMPKVQAHPLELELNKLITSLNDKLPRKRRRKKLKVNLPTCHASSSSEENNQRKSGSNSTLKKKKQLSKNVDYITNQRTISNFGSQHPLKKENCSIDLSVEIEIVGQKKNLQGRTRNSSPNNYEEVKADAILTNEKKSANHNGTLKNQSFLTQWNAMKAKEYGNKTGNGRDNCDLQIVGHKRSLHSRIRSSLQRNLEEHSILLKYEENEEKYKGGNHVLKYQNEESLGKDKPLKAKEIEAISGNKTYECDIEIVGHKRNLHSRIRSNPQGNLEKHSTLLKYDGNEEKRNSGNHALKYQNEKSLVKETSWKVKEIEAFPGNKANECDIDIIGRKMILNSQIRSSLQRNLKHSTLLNYEENEEKRSSGNHAIKYQNEECLIKEKSLKAKEIRAIPINNTNECDLEIVGHRRNLHSRIRSKSPENLQENLTLFNSEENKENPSSEENNIMEKFRNTPKNQGHKSNLHNRIRKKKVEVKFYPALSGFDENEEQCSDAKKKPRNQGGGSPINKGRQKEFNQDEDFYNWDRLAPQRIGSFEETKILPKHHNLRKIPEKHQHDMIKTYFGSNDTPSQYHSKKINFQSSTHYLEKSFLEEESNEEIPTKAETCSEKHIKNQFGDYNGCKQSQIKEIVMGTEQSLKDCNSHGRFMTPTISKNQMEFQNCKENVEAVFEENLTGGCCIESIQNVTHSYHSSILMEKTPKRTNLEFPTRIEEKHVQIDEETLIGKYSKGNNHNPEARDWHHGKDEHLSKEKGRQINETCTCCEACLEPSPKLDFSNSQTCVYEILSSSGHHLEESEENFICSCSYTGACFRRDVVKPKSVAKEKPSSRNYLEENQGQIDETVIYNCPYTEACLKCDSQNRKREDIPKFLISSEEKPCRMGETLISSYVSTETSPKKESQFHSIIGDGLQNSTAKPLDVKLWKATGDNFINQNCEETSPKMVSKDGDHSETFSTPPLKRNLGLESIQLETSPKGDSLSSTRVNFSGSLIKVQNSKELIELDYTSPYPETHSNRTSVTFMESIESNKLNADTAMEPKKSILKDTFLTERGPQEVKYGLLLPPNRSPLKILLVFIQTDPVSDAMSRAADKLGFDVTFCSSYDGALEEFLSKLHDLVIIDTRTSAKSLDFDTLCRSIRNTKGSQHTAVVAIVKKSAFDKDDVTVLSLLDAGYNRCIVETSNIVHCVNELIQLKHSDMRPMAQAATSQALYAALDKCRDIVLITDDSYRLQYANRASERNLGYRHDETLGKTLQEQLIHDPVQMNTMSSSLMRAREWQGQITLRRKGQEAMASICKAVPITCAGRAPTHFVMVMDLSGSIEPIAATPDKPRGSVHSIRRASTDVRSVGSDFLRRTSLAKLSALPLEAPITKIITLLAQAQEQSTPQVVSIIDKAVEILHSTELYSPQVKDDLRLRSDEPVTSDLISALLTQPHQPSISISSRRSSNDSSSVIRSANRPVSKVKIPTQLRDLLDTSLTWEFDIFRLEELTNRRPLVHLGMSLFTHFDVPATLNCDEKTLVNWLTVIEVNYHTENAYHNSTHAADVMQATAGFLERDRLKSIMEPLDEATSLLAACAHDIDHPGKSSAFLSNCDNPLAILYNDVTVLENHHAALTFKLTLGDDRVNIFKHLDRETYKVARHNVIDMILATEMTKHFEHLAKFVNVFCAKTSRTDLETEEYIPITLPENITLVKRMMIKCADVSNPTRPLRLCVEWARRIAEEYFTQTDDEKSRGLPVVMPMFDRTTCSIPKSQIGFVDYIVHDMFEAWDAFIDMPELVMYMRQNYIRWKEFDEQGHTTSGDIRKLQNTVLMAPMFPSKNPPKRSE